MPPVWPKSLQGQPSAANAMYRDMVRLTEVIRSAFGWSRCIANKFSPAIKTFVQSRLTLLNCSNSNTVVAANRAIQPQCIIKSESKARNSRVVFCACAALAGKASYVVQSRTGIADASVLVFIVIIIVHASTRYKSFPARRDDTHDLAAFRLCRTHSHDSPMTVRNLITTRQCLLLLLLLRPPPSPPLVLLLPVALQYKHLALDDSPTVIVTSTSFRFLLLPSLAPALSDTSSSDQLRPWPH